MDLVNRDKNAGMEVNVPIFLCKSLEFWWVPLETRTGMGPEMGDSV